MALIITIGKSMSTIFALQKYRQEHPISISGQNMTVVKGLQRDIAASTSGCSKMNSIGDREE